MCRKYTSMLPYSQQENVWIFSRQALREIPRRKEAGTKRPASPVSTRASYGAPVPAILPMEMVTSPSSTETVTTVKDSSVAFTIQVACLREASW